MVEYTEADLAREMDEEMKTDQPITAKSSINVVLQSGLGGGFLALPKGRAPPRRKTASSNLVDFVQEKEQAAAAS